MSQQLEFVTFVLDQVKDAGVITYKKMFGAYGLYCGGKFFACIDDDQLFVKLTQAGRKFVPDCPLAPPYEGAKDYLLIEDIENREVLSKLVQLTCEELPMPKPKVKKQKKAQ